MRGECIECGAYLADQDQQYCEDCILDHMHVFTFKVRVTDDEGWIWACEEFEEQALEFDDIKILPYAQEMADRHGVNLCDCEVDAWVVDVS